MVIAPGHLQYAGSREPGGARQSGHLSFDDYEQDESLRLGTVRDGDASREFLEFLDRPAWSLADVVEGSAQPGDGPRSRMRLAREEDGSVGLVLRDGEGRDRVRLVVPEDGEPEIEVVGADGVAALAAAGMSTGTTKGPIAGSAQTAMGPCPRRRDAWESRKRPGCGAPPGE